MLPPTHVAYTWLGLTIIQKKYNKLQEVDYRILAIAALGPDLVDKPLAWAYFYERYKSAVLFGHTLLSFVIVGWLGLIRKTSWKPYALGFVGHALCDRLWKFPDTFYWPLRGWRFQVWGKQGGQQDNIGSAYWVTFTRRPELWGWELGGLVALILVVYWHRLFEPGRLWRFLRTGRPESD